MVYSFVAQQRCIKLCCLCYYLLQKQQEFIYNLFMTRHSNTVSKPCSLCHLIFVKYLISSFHLRFALWMGRSLYSRRNQVLYQVSSSGGKWVRVEIKAQQTKHIFKPRINGKIRKITKAVICVMYVFITNITCPFLGFFVTSLSRGFQRSKEQD